jgi:acyl-CoA thioester hydrolase
MTNQAIIVHKKTFNVAWGDMDALGHVNNARYFDYFQETRIEWLAELHISLAQDTGPVVIHAACTFLKPVIYPATVTIISSVHSLGNSSFIMNHDLYQNDQLMAEGMCKVVWTDYMQKKSIAVPENLRDLFA